MVKVISGFFLVFLMALMSISSCQAYDIYHEFGMQHRQFSAASNANQAYSNSALSINSFYSYAQGEEQWNGELWLRLDKENSERNHLDLREFYWLNYGEDYEWQIGVARVFWGVTESAHLVDVINQTDQLEGLDGEDKLGQAMIHYTKQIDNGQVEWFLLPYFRPQKFYDVGNRFAPPMNMDKKALYDSGALQRHLDSAVRLTQHYGAFDWSVMAFSGTNREPIVQLKGETGQAFYGQMQQLGITAQYIQDAWIYKAELMLRKNRAHVLNQDQKSRISAVVLGAEYTQVGIFSTVYDLGYLIEYQSDNRDKTQVLGQNDLFIGTRLAFNDSDSSEMILGVLHDLTDASQSIRLEASMRLGQSTKLEVAAYHFNGKGDNWLKQLNKQDLLEINLFWYFSH